MAENSDWNYLVGRVFGPPLRPHRLHVHWYKYVFRRGAWTYYECRCGRRMALRSRGIVGPCWMEWVNRKHGTPTPAAESN